MNPAKPQKLEDSSRSDGSGDGQFACRHCGKRSVVDDLILKGYSKKEGFRYRWKSTMRRHEQVECGGKEPTFGCPQCPYRAKQKGNLGVHMRKYHQRAFKSEILTNNNYCSINNNNLTGWFFLVFFQFCAKFLVRMWYFFSVILYFYQGLLSLVMVLYRVYQLG